MLTKHSAPEFNCIMEKSCEVFMKYVPATSEREDLRATYIVNCVFNSFLSYTAVLLNIFTIHAITKTWALPKPLKTLLLSLAVSDVGVGLFVQPYYTSLLVKWLQHKNPGCISYKVFFVVLSLFAISSFFGVVAISVDRFLAIHLHLRYQEVVTERRVVAVVVSLWVLSAVVALVTWWYPHDSSVIIFAVGTVCLMITTMIYSRIYLVLRRHKVHIRQNLRVQQAAPNGSDMTSFANLKKSAAGVFYVYLVFMACYLPRGCNLFLIVISEPTTTVKGFSLYAWTVMFLNSSLNPVIYCLKMRHIRHAVIDILRSISWNGYCVSH